jgi:hypothetical protein
MENKFAVIEVVCYDRVSNSLGLITVFPTVENHTIGSLSLGKEVMLLVIHKRGKKTVKIDVVNQKQDLDIAFIGEL